MRELVWTQRALSDLRTAFDFNLALYGKQKTLEITSKILDRVEILLNPELDFSAVGAPDEDFMHLKRKYRKLIEGHYKITYREGKGKIYINRIFDTRRNPNKNK